MELESFKQDQNHKPGSNHFSEHKIEKTKDNMEKAYSTSESTCMNSDNGQRSSYLAEDRPIGWFGVDGALFGEEAKKWKKPPTSPASQSCPRRMHEDWIGGYDSSPVCESSLVRERPKQIKIEGMQSIKNNPFLKNFGQL